MRALLLASLAACTALAAPPLDVEDAPRSIAPPPPEAGALVAVPTDSGAPRLEKTCDAACTFEPAGDLAIDPAIHELCSWFFDHLDACGLDVSPSRADCPRIARTGGDPLVRYFDCVLRGDCTPNPPACQLAPSTLGRDLATTRAPRCPALPAIPEGRRALLDDLGAQRKPTVIALAHACVTDQPCDAVDACLDAWIDL